MSLIQLKSIDISFGGPKLLEGINLSIDPLERISLVGRNGAGKSSLLKIINGELLPDSGEIIKSKDLKITRLDQNVPTTFKGNIFQVVSQGLLSNEKYYKDYQEAITKLENEISDENIKKLEIAQQQLENTGGWNTHQKVEKILTKLRLEKNLIFSALSGGVKRRVLLAKSLVLEPDILLLDEPTNHLDIDSIVWLEDFLKSCQITLVFISHDRSFLSALATRIIEIDRGELFNYVGSYTGYINNREKRWSDEQKKSEDFNKKLTQEEIWIRQGIKARRTRNEGRVKELKKLRETFKNKRTRQGIVKLSSSVIQKSGKIVIEAQSISFKIGNKYLFDDFSCVIRRGDRVGVIGPNGIGKTTLIKILLSDLKPFSGYIKVGTKLKISYFDQLRKILKENLSVFDNLSEGREFIEFTNKKIHVMTYLQDFLFTPERIRTPVSALSGGEKNRLLLAKLFAKEANLLVLDEPTNDLDSETLELLEEKLQTFKGTLILVSHDRAFINKVVTNCIVFEDSGLNEYIGGYDDWIRQKPHVYEKTKTKSLFNGKKEKKNKLKTSSKLSFNEKLLLEKLPEKISGLENELSNINQKLVDSNLYKEHPNEVKILLKKINVLEKEIEENICLWEELEGKSVKK